MAADITTLPITTKKLSELVSIGAVADLDVVYVLDVSTGQSRKTTVASLLALAPGSTNLSITGITATTVTVASDTGTDAVIPAATPSAAGLMRATDKSKLDNISVGGPIDLDEISATLGDTVANLIAVEAKTDYISVTQPVNLDTMESDETALITLSGVTAGATNLGTFTGTTIPDSRKVKEALQSLETAYEETDVNANDLITLSGRPENSANLGVFTGTIIPDNTTIKSALQSLESNSALNDFSSTTAPVVTDDSDSGFSIGSVMVDTVTDKSYICLDATVGAAVWKETTNEVGGGTDNLVGVGSINTNYYNLYIPFGASYNDPVEETWTIANITSVDYQSAGFQNTGRASTNGTGVGVELPISTKEVIMQFMATPKNPGGLPRAESSFMGFNLDSTRPVFGSNTESIGFIIANNNDWYIRVANGTGFTETAISTPTAAPHVFRIEADFDDAEMRFYIDSVLVGTITTNLPTSATGIFIGNGGSGSGGGFIERAWAPSLSTKL